MPGSLGRKAYAGEDFLRNKSAAVGFRDNRGMPQDCRWYNHLRGLG